MDDTPFNVDQVNIKTASIAIQTLYVNKRQLTLSTFRQIKEESVVTLYDSDFELKGEPWATVNYHWGYQPKEYLHLIWSKGNEPRRMQLLPTTPMHIGYTGDVYIPNSTKENLRLLFSRWEDELNKSFDHYQHHEREKLRKRIFELLEMEKEYIEEYNELMVTLSKKDHVFIATG